MIKKILKKVFRKSIIQKLYSQAFYFYSALTILPLRPFAIKKEDRILLLAPHADDEVIGCGGLLLKYPNQCDIICLTDGRYGDKNIGFNQMIEIRKNEFISVMNKLGITNFKFLEIEDTKLQYKYDTFNQIDFNNYDFIFIPNSLEQHPDHRAVAKHIVKAYKEKLIKKGQKIIMYEVWGALPIVNYYIDISNNIKQKSEIINMYHSQIKNIDYANKILGLNFYRGLLVNKTYIETYLLVNIEDLEI